MTSDKVRPHHLERKALLYVRKSPRFCTTARADAMRDRLTALGWSKIEVIDDDLGRSAAGGVLRAGLSGWWRKCASARLGPSQRARSRASLATAGIGNS